MSAPNREPSIEEKVAQVTARINAAEKSAGRIPGIVQLIAVSKTRSAIEIRHAHAASLAHFGENYLREALDKQQALTDLALTWHFIGPIQSNKTADIAANFHWVHSVDRPKIARRLNDQRPEQLGPLNICLQVNISEEATKSGISLQQLPALADEIAPFERIRLRGLMSIPAPNQSDQALRADFGRMRQALEQLNNSGFELDTLSMGMSNDLEFAIAEGATMVRVGTAIFGARE